LGDGEDWTVVDEESMTEDDSLVAAAGSNGVVVVWNAKKLLFSDSGTAQAPPKTRAGGFMTTSSFSTSAAALAMKQRTQQPEGILSQHTRAVHCMEWHPTRSGLLLTASQDGSVKLWERKLVIDPEDLGDDQSKLAEQQQQFSWFSMVGGGSGNGGKGSSTNDDDSRQYSWGCKATYSLGEQDAIRDVSWNPHLPDFFGVVTSNGNLVVYNMNVASKAVVKIAAHTGDASSLDWHPRWPFVVATGGSSDRFVKIWDLESSLGSIANTDTTTNNNRANAPPIPPRREFVPHPRKETPPPQHENSNTHEAAKSDTSSHSVSSNESM
jgi:WD40 repeat protein